MSGSDFLLLAVDLALVVLMIEAALLLALRRRHRLPALTIMLIALSGIGLLLALRGALAGASPLIVLAGLSLGGLAHAVDLVRRLRAD